jgi:DNA-binding NtrC family response regulator
MVLVCSFREPAAKAEDLAKTMRHWAGHQHTVLNGSHVPRPAEEEPPGSERTNKISEKDLTLENAMRRHITTVLELSKHNLTEAARKLGIPRTTLRDKTKKFGIPTR